MLRPSRLALFSLVLLTASGCGSGPDAAGSLTVTPARIDLPHGAWRRLELAWTMNAPLSGLEGEPRVSLHLVDRSGAVVRTFDHPLPAPWAPGGTAVYDLPVFQSAIGPPLELGAYELRAGLYDGAGHRWTVTPRRAARVRVAEPAEGDAEISFSAQWRPTEGGADRQILARRWLDDDGAIRVRGYTSPGALWLRIGIPRPNELQVMELEEGAAEPAATVRAECSGFAAFLAGVGSHTVEIPLEPVTDSAGECRIELGANFVLVSQDNGERRTIALENVAWGG